MIYNNKKTFALSVLLAFLACSALSAQQVTLVDENFSSGSLSGGSLTWGGKDNFLPTVVSPASGWGSSAGSYVAQFQGTSYTQTGFMLPQSIILPADTNSSLSLKFDLLLQNVSSSSQFRAGIFSSDTLLSGNSGTATGGIAEIVSNRTKALWRGPSAADQGPFFGSRTDGPVNSGFVFVDNVVNHVELQINRYPDDARLQVSLYINGNWISSMRTPGPVSQYTIDGSSDYTIDQIQFLLGDTSTIYQIDNILITATNAVIVPEPSSVGIMMGLGCLLFLAGRRYIRRK